MSDASVGPLPLLVRLRAWWEGYDPQEYELWRSARLTALDSPVGERIALPELEPIDLLTRDAAGEGADFEFAEEENPDPVWPRAKLEVAQRVFGRGFTTPGGADHVVDMGRPLGLNPAQSVLDTSVGLGGPAAALAEHFGTWITGYEKNSFLVEQAPEALKTLPAGDHVEANELVLETLELPRKKYDVVLSLESMHRVNDRIMLLGKMRGALKDWGQLLLTDYVVPNDEMPSGRVQAWMKARGEPVTLWTREQYEVALANQGLDIRIVKDESAKQAELIRTAFQHFVSEIDANAAVTTNAIGRQALMSLAEDWSRLAGLLADGELQLVRFLALKPEQE